MNAKIFSGSPQDVEIAIQKWLKDTDAQNRKVEIVKTTQTQNNGSIVLVVFYKLFMKESGGCSAVF